MANVFLDDMAEMTNRYHNTYIYDKANQQVIHCHEFTRAGMRGSTLDGDEVMVPLKDVDINQPELGVFNIGKGVVHIANLPRRQWRRGLRLDTLVLKHVVNKEVRALEGERMPDRAGSSVILKEIFNPTYHGVRQALRRVTEFEDVACAFNRKFFFAVKEGYADIVVGYKGFIVGTVSNNVVSLFKGYAHLKEELSQYIQVEDK